MKKNLLKVVLVLSIVGAALACEKDNQCWICDDEFGNDLPEVCNAADKQKIEANGGHCWAKD